MLDNRYLYLHQALELGPMWLSQHVRIIAPQISQTTTQKHLPETATTINPSVKHSKPAAIQAMLTEPNRIPAAPITAALPVQAKNEVKEEIEQLPEKEPIETNFKLAELATILNTCQRCSLHQQRSQPISGSGAEQPRLLVISTNPAPEDDANHQLFSGQAGILLRNMLAAIEVNPNEVFYTSQVKCAPNISLHIKQEHIQACTPYLNEQIRQLRPRAILLLGQMFQRIEPNLLAASLHHVPYVIVPHPARLLSQRQLKAKAWQSLQVLRSYLNAPN